MSQASTPAAESPSFWRACPRLAVSFGTLMRRTIAAAFDHDVLTVAQATAYAAVVGIFPTLIVAAAIVGFLPDTQPLRFQLAVFFARILPSNVSPIFATYFVTTHKTQHTAGAILSAAIVSLAGAVSVLTTLMEGFRRAHHLPLTRRSFWPRRLRALALVPLSLVPMTLATVLVVFGHFLTHVLVVRMPQALHVPVYLLAFLLRWTIALTGSVTIIAVIYHLGTNMNTGVSAELKPLLREPQLALRRDWTWRASLPGATLATGLWFVATLLFGLYVTRFANYSRVYGSLGAAIALMVWLYIIAICILIGAEFNGQIAAQRRNNLRAAVEDAPLPSSPTGKITD